MNVIIEVSKNNVKVYENKSLSKTLFSLLDGIYDISIKKHENKRSLLQNRYYWGMVIPFIMDFFNSFERTTPMNEQQAHAQFKDIAGLYEDVQIYDKEQQEILNKRIYRSFSDAGDLSTMEFNDMCDVLREAIASLSGGIYILPEPITFL